MADKQNIDTSLDRVRPIDVVKDTPVYIIRRMTAEEEQKARLKREADRAAKRAGKPEIEGYPRGTGQFAKEEWVKSQKNDALYDNFIDE